MEAESYNSKASVHKRWEDFLKDGGQSPGSPLSTPIARTDSQSRIANPRPESAMASTSGRKSIQEQLYNEAKERETRRQELRKRLDADNSKPQFRVTGESVKMATNKFFRDAKRSFARYAETEVEDLEHGEHNVCYDEFMAILHQLGYWRPAPGTTLTMVETKTFTELTNALDPFQDLAVCYKKFLELIGFIAQHKFNGAPPAQSGTSGRRTLPELAWTLFQSGEANRMSYRPKTALVNVESPTFKPSINRASSQMLDSRPKQTLAEKYDDMMIAERRKKERLEEARAEKEKRMLEECTFAPTTNKVVGTVAAKTKPAHLRLYHLAGQTPAHAEELQTEQKEIAKHCTFKPTVSHKIARPTHFPRGYQEKIDRAARARAERDRVKQELEEPKYTDETYQQSLRRREQSEFRFASQQRAKERQSKKPLLYIDVNLPNGRSGRIGIHLGDDPSELARSFAAVYKLDREMRIRLTGMIEEHMLRFLPGHIAPVPAPGADSELDEAYPPAPPHDAGGMVNPFDAAEDQPGMAVEDEYRDGAGAGMPDDALDDDEDWDDM